MVAFNIINIMHHTATVAVAGGHGVTPSAVYRGLVVWGQRACKRPPGAGFAFGAGPHCAPHFD